MALQLGALRDALVEAGATPDKARAAAEEVAAYERDVSTLKTDLAEVKGDVKVLRWMVGTCITLTLLVIGGEMALWARMGELSGRMAQLASGLH